MAVFITPRFKKKFSKIKDARLKKVILSVLSRFHADPRPTVKVLDSYSGYLLAEIKPPHSIPYRVYVVHRESDDTWFVVDLDTKDRQQQAISRLRRILKMWIQGEFSFKNSESG